MFKTIVIIRGIMKKLFLGTKQQDIGKLFFDKFSHKKIVITAGTLVAQNAQDLQNVPLKTLQAYNLVGNRHEKRAQIHEYAQQIGNTYADIMQKLNAEENISSYDLQNFANGINFLFENKQKITPNMITTLEKATKNVANQIGSLLEQQRQNIEPNMINALARGIDSLTQQNKNIEPNMINTLARGIDSLTQQNKNIEPNMIKTLARGIDSLLSSNIKKDLSYELKVLSQVTLTFISNDYSVDNLKNLYTTFQSLHTRIKEKETIPKLPTLTPAEGETYLDTLKQDRYTNSKESGPCCYKRNSSEIYNFMLSYKSLSGLFNACHKDNETEEKIEHKNTRSKQFKEDATIILIKLKTPAMFKDNVNIETIINNYAKLEQKEVGIKNSDIDKTDDKFIFFTHQYDSSKPHTDLRLSNGENIMIQKDSKVEIANNDENIKKLNKLISMLEPQCHENSYACLTHLVHRAIERYGKIDNNKNNNNDSVYTTNKNYDLDKTIESVEELIQLKNSILTKTNKSQIKNDKPKLQKTVKWLQKEIEKSQPDIKKIKEKLENLVSLELLEETNFIETINKLISKLSYESFDDYVEKNNLYSIVAEALTYVIKKAKLDENKKIPDNEVKNIFEKSKTIKTKENDKKAQDVSRIVGDLKLSVEKHFDIAKNSQIDNTIKEAIKDTIKKTITNAVGWDKEVKVNSIESFKQELNVLFTAVKNAMSKDTSFTLTRSTQVDKYNYKAYELTTKLGTLILDNKGKISTIIDKTI